MTISERAEMQATISHYKQRIKNLKQSVTELTAELEGYRRRERIALNAARADSLRAKEERGRVAEDF
jgi:demethoxyubiquinone hydroxylase (CLK1/Coq7/Cat5 family)